MIHWHGPGTPGCHTVAGVTPCQWRRPGRRPRPFWSLEVLRTARPSRVRYVVPCAALRHGCAMQTGALLSTVMMMMMRVHACFGSHASSPLDLHDPGSQGVGIVEARAGADATQLRCAAPDHLQRRLDSLHSYARTRSRPPGPAMMPLDSRVSLCSKHGGCWRHACALRGPPPSSPPPPPPPDDSDDDECVALPLSALRGGAWLKGRNTTSHLQKSVDWHTWWTGTDWYLCQRQCGDTFARHAREPCVSGHGACALG